jgi:hypothetical protein
MPAAATAAIVGGTSIASGVMNSAAADNANKAAQRASAANLAQAQKVYADTQGNLNPFIQGGQTANTALMGLLGIGGSPEAANNAFNQFRNSTNYNFLLNQGLQGVQSANAQSFNSGATAKALSNYAQGMAGNALAGYMGQLGALGSQGVQAASNLGSLGQNYTQQSAGFRNNAATAAATNANSQAAAFSQALQGAMPLLNMGATGLSSFMGGGPSAFTQADINAINPQLGQVVIPKTGLNDDFSQFNTAPMGWAG